MKGFGELNKAIINIKKEYKLSNSEIYRLLNKELDIIKKQIIH